MAKVEETINLMKSENTYRRYEEGDHKYSDFSKQIFNEDTSHKCPTYIHKTPPCQGSCPSGEDINAFIVAASPPKAFRIAISSKA